MSKKIFTTKIIVLFILFILLITPNIYAVDEVFSGGDDFIDTGSSGGDSPISTSNLKAISDIIYNVLLGIGVVTAVIVAAVLGIQFMTGSMEEQAKVKESLIPFVVGCIIVFGAFGIWKAIAVIVQKV